MFLLDTDICSAHLRCRPGLTHRFIQHGGRLFIGTPVLAELHAWAYMREDASPVLAGIAELLGDLSVIDFDVRAAECFGQLRGALRRRGNAMAPMDLAIAAIALANDLTLVTHNTGHFANVPEVRVLDWLAS